MASRKDIPTPKGDASKSAAQSAAADATKDKGGPLEVTQDPNLSEEERQKQLQAEDCSRNETRLDNKALRSCTRTGKPNADDEPGVVKPIRDSNPETFEALCEEIGKGIKKLTEAGCGAGVAADLAAKLYLGGNSPVCNRRM